MSALRVVAASAALLVFAAMTFGQRVYVDKLDFGVYGIDAKNPEAGVAYDAAGDLFGTTAGEGTGEGVVWEITAAGAYKILHTFGGTVTNADGMSGPDGFGSASLVLIDGSNNLYGTAQYGGAYFLLPPFGNGGMLWEITSSGVYKDLHDFGGTVTNADGSSGPDGVEPMGYLFMDGFGNLSGVATLGGPFASANLSTNAGGIIWELTAAGAYKDLHDFGGTTLNANGVLGPDGQSPEGGVIEDSAGDLYGAAATGGPNLATSGGSNSGCGMLWELAAGGTYTDLHDFGGTITNADGQSGPDGQAPGYIVMDSSGDLYGNAFWGGASVHANGMLWKLTTDGSYTDLHDFGGTVINANGKNGPDGIDPLGPVALDASGDLFGTTEAGGPNPSLPGMAWELTPAGQYTDIHDFGGTVTLANGVSGKDGGEPDGITVNQAGNLYGVCEDYQEGGMVWEIVTQRIVSLTLGPSTIGGLGTSTATVTIAAPAPAGGYKVNLNPGASGYLNMPTSVTIEPNHTSATFTIKGTAQRSATINMGIIATGPYTYMESILTIQGDEVNGLSFSPSSIGGSGSTTATVTIASAAPPGGWIINLKAAASGYLAMPSTVTVPAGATSTTFTISGTTQRTGTAGIGVIASDGNASVESILTVDGDLLKSITLSPTSMGWSGTSTATLTLNSPAPEGGWVVNLKAGASGYLSMPSSVTVPAGATTATFSITGTSQRTESVTIGVIANDIGNQVETDLTLTGDSLTGVSVNPSSVAPGGSSTGTVTVSGPAPVGGWVVKLWAGAPSDVQVPATVTVPAGATSVTFSITTATNAHPSTYGVFANDETAQFEAFLTIT